MKPVLFLLAMFPSILLAQDADMFGKFTKADGKTIEGTSTAIRYEKQVIIKSSVAGPDNSNTIEIEIPAGAAVAAFKNSLNNASPGKTMAAKPVSPTKVRAVPANTKPVLTATIPALTEKLQRAEITVTKLEEGRLQVAQIIFMEDIQVISCQDDINAGSSRIKLKSARYGTKYYIADRVGNTTTSKSGWDVSTNAAWTNF